jgi:hypothetical protein
MKSFKELKRGEAFKCLETCYIKISNDKASNAICLHNGHHVTFCDEAGVIPIYLSYRYEGDIQLDFSIPRRPGI